MTDVVATFGERVQAAMGDLAYLEKKGWNAHFKYAFVQEAEVKRAASEALRKHGLMISSVSYAPVGECSGKAATIHCVLTIGDTKGDGEVRYSGIGAGADSSDKAPMKAMAAALKYALTSGFLIATGEDPEEDGGTAQKNGKDKTAPKSTSDDKPAKSASDDTSSEPDAVAKLSADVAACKTLADLAKLKVAVSKLRGEPGFDELADAFKAKGAALKAAETKEAA